MFRSRRFRGFLLVTVILCICAYEFGYINVNQQSASLQIPGNPAPFVPPTPAQIRPEDSAPLPQAPKEQIDSEKYAAAQQDGATPARPAVGAARTVTGDEFLKKQSSDFELTQQGQGRLDVRPRPEDKPKAQWRQQEEHFPVDKIIHMPIGEPQQLPQIQYAFGPESSTEKKERVMKQNVIREAFKHAWAGYTTYAMGHDELKPVSNGTADTFNGWGATLVDSLDTLWMMGLKSEFESAVGHVAKIDFKTSPRKDIPLFETNIRYLGGLLAAYDISAMKYTVLLDKAVELAEVLMGAFDTPNRMPMPYYNWAPSYASQPHRSDSNTVMSELGTLAMEFTRLAQITKEEKYYDAVARCTNALDEWQEDTSIPGVWPVRLDSSGCKKSTRRIDKALSDEEPTRGNAGGLRKRQSDDGPANPALGNAPAGIEEDEEPYDFVAMDGNSEDVFNSDCVAIGLAHEPHGKPQVYSIGAMADSTYEYFPKMHMLLGGRSEQYRHMYTKAADVIRKDFVYRPMLEDETRDVRFTSRHEIYPTEKDPATRKQIIYEGSHLGCFVGGMFALGSKLFNIPSDMSLAAKLTDGCVWAYESTLLGIMPEKFTLTPCADVKNCPWEESRWHAALDENLQERFDGVARYNAQQKALAEAALDEAGSNTVPAAEEARRFSPSDKRKRQDTPIGKLPDWKAPDRTIHAAPDKEPVTHETTSSNPSPQSPFIPKVALSHASYVRARISEERLPPSYTSMESRSYKLRPEALESVFIMYRLTGDSVWREKGWKMFQAIEAASRTASGHAAVKDVTSVLGEVSDTMESFWLAETLKYAWLLWSEPTEGGLDDWVFNTEAHPFRVPKASSRAS